jgi:hypothetical protein
MVLGLRIEDIAALMLFSNYQKDITFTKPEFTNKEVTVSYL